MFFLGTISSISSTDAQQFDGSATPDLVLIDSEYRDVIWIDVKHPSTWDEEVYNQLNEAWRASEGIGYYFKEQPKDEDILEREMDSLMTIPKVEDNTEVIDKLQRQIDSLKAVNGL